MHALLIGHITEDRMAGVRRLGGAASFAAKIASLAGIKTTLITSAPSEFPYWSELGALNNLSIKNIVSPYATTFELKHHENKRQLQLIHQARNINLLDLDLIAYDPDLVFYAPVINEIETQALEQCTPFFSLIGLQGFLRRKDNKNILKPASFNPEPFLAFPAKLIGLSVEDHPEAAEIANILSSKSIVALTHGQHGATIYESPSIQHHIPALKTKEVDPTGAGDAFLFRLGLGLARNELLLDAAHAAATAAAYVVQGPGLGQLQSSNFR